MAKSVRPVFVVFCQEGHGERGFLSILKEAGLKFSYEDFLPGLVKICRIEHDRSGIGAIVPTGGHDPGGRRDS